MLPTLLECCVLVLGRLLSCINWLALLLRHLLFAIISLNERKITNDNWRVMLAGWFGAARVQNRPRTTPPSLQSLGTFLSAPISLIDYRPSSFCKINRTYYDIKKTNYFYIFNLHLLIFITNKMRLLITYNCLPTLKKYLGSKPGFTYAWDLLSNQSDIWLLSHFYDGRLFEGMRFRI